MNAKFPGDSRLTMLMACASPGSALAYHLGLATFEPLVLRRDKATDGNEPAPGAGEAGQREGEAA